MLFASGQWTWQNGTPHWEQRLACSAGLRRCRTRRRFRGNRARRSPASRFSGVCWATRTNCSMRSAIAALSPQADAAGHRRASRCADIRRVALFRESQIAAYGSITVLFSILRQRRCVRPGSLRRYRPGSVLYDRPPCLIAYAADRGCRVPPPGRKRRRYSGTTSSTGVGMMPSSASPAAPGATTLSRSSIAAGPG